MSNFILTLKLKTQPFHEDLLNKRLEIGRQMYNSCLGELYKRYRTLKQSKEYQSIRKMKKGKVKNKRFSDLNKEYGLTEYSLHTYVKPIQQHFKKNIDSFTAQKIATRCFSAFQKLMFHEADKVKFKRYSEMISLEGKSNRTGIRFNENMLLWNGLSIPVIIKKNDEYAQMSLCNKVKYCRIVRKLIRGTYKFYVQLVLDGFPPKKFNKETGEIKNRISDGKVGLDIGTQTIAIASKADVKLFELASNINTMERGKLLLQRKLDRQRRANNPNKYNNDGTVKRNTDKWIRSNRYNKTQIKLAEIQRKIACKRKQSHEKLANYILTLGDQVYVETMNYKGLQARSKNTSINEKTGKFNKKKRFGKSLANKAPSMFLTILDNKLKWQGEQLLKIDTFKIKASQYNHFTNEYVKKSLSERWNDFDEFRIQRDLYSAFIIMCTKYNLKETDRQLCINEFKRFKELHDIEIDRIRNSNNKIISSMGI